jgi:hypothetical protein
MINCGVQEERHGLMVASDGGYRHGLRLNLWLMIDDLKMGCLQLEWNCNGNVGLQLEKSQGARWWQYSARELLSLPTICKSKRQKHEPIRNKKIK